MVMFRHAITTQQFCSLPGTNQGPGHRFLVMSSVFLKILLSRDIE